MAEVEVKSCSNPGCDQPGKSSCSACKTTVYCCVTCQTADWPRHKEECDGHLRKLGNANLEKAQGFYRQRNYVQALRFAELAAIKLRQLKDRLLETVLLIDSALACKYNALNFMARHREAMECAEERYTVWAMNQMRNRGSINAALPLIQSCLHNEEYEDAERYARHAMFMINDMTDNFIPSDERPRYLADASYWLAQASLRLAMAGGIPPEGKQKAGEEVIELARKALEIHTQLHGTESAIVAADMIAIGEAKGHFNNVDDDEISHLFEQAIAIYRRVQGSSSVNVATCEFHLAGAYLNRANRAQVINDVDRYVANLELALPHYREADRIYRAINIVDRADESLRTIAEIEGKLRRVRIAISAAAAATAAAAAATTTMG